MTRVLDADGPIAPEASLADTDVDMSGPTNPTGSLNEGTDHTPPSINSPDGAPSYSADAWDEAVSTLSASGKQWSTSLPEDWPFGVRANLRGSPARISTKLRRARVIPWDPDITAWDALEALAPVADSDGTSDRKNDFLRTAAITWAMEGAGLALRALILSPTGDRAMEPWPFDTKGMSPLQVVLWFADHGIEPGSTIARSLHLYARELAPTYGTVLSDLPDGDTYLRGELIDMSVLPSGFSYPPMASEMSRNWITKSEEYIQGLNRPAPASSAEPTTRNTSTELKKPKSRKRATVKPASSVSPRETDWGTDDTDNSD